MPGHAHHAEARVMSGRRGLLLVILMYVTLDLSLPMVPGAFVFDPADSIESVQNARGRPAARVAIRAAPVGDSFKLSPPFVNHKPRITPMAAVALPVHPVASYRARATVDPAPRPEDPH
jgi:hypothetical protein